jgi:hypothetical protein
MSHLFSGCEALRIDQEILYLSLSHKFKQTKLLISFIWNKFVIIIFNVIHSILFYTKISLEIIII